MATHREVLDQINVIINEVYTNVETTSVPKKEDLTFWNTTKTIKHAKVMFIDMRRSRDLLLDWTTLRSVKTHKAFLRAISHCIWDRDGHIRSFNGDGLLAFFVGEEAWPKSVRAAMDIAWFVTKINEHLTANAKNPIDFWIWIASRTSTCC